MADEIINPDPDTDATIAPDAAPAATPLDTDVNADAPEAETYVDPMAQYRTGTAHALTEPPAADPATWDVDAMMDYGHASKAIGLDAGAAQALLNVWAGDASAPQYGYEQPSLSELRGAFGTDPKPVLEKIEAFCASKPQLSAFLDSSGVGNDLSALVLLAGASEYPAVIDRKKAPAWIAATLANTKHPYWHGSKVAVAAMRIATAIGESK